MIGAPPTPELFAEGDAVSHSRHGQGVVLATASGAVLVRFGEAIHSCLPKELARWRSVDVTLREPMWDPPVRVVQRLQAEAIRSANDTWGIFARGKIDLLPHQLWVCKQVNQRWPTRWLVADDVGLGKTIEAGLILSPLIAKGLVTRLLIICPASLVGQWQERMLRMFDIRIAQYASDADKANTQFWSVHNQVVASMQTLRIDRGGRHERLFSAPPWDMVIVDEAHHLSVSDQGDYTLAYRLVERLEKQRLIRSMVFLTGTPHRGKPEAFWALLRLLQPERFSAQRPPDELLPLLRDVMIRNNKQSITDMDGNQVFSRPVVHSETYKYSPEEEYFYWKLTEFIANGRAYAGRLTNEAEGRAVILVLISIQKLASSSVAAVVRALQGRLARIDEATRTKPEHVDPLRRQRTVHRFTTELQEYLTAENHLEFDLLGAQEEELASRQASLRLLEHEVPALKELIDAAGRVKRETKIARLIEIVDDRFAEKNILFFTEYKATQSLLISELMARYGRESVTFINGEDYARDVRDPVSGEIFSLRITRAKAAGRFNDGASRFLVSTEAGGEGIDLQRRCHTLVHVDLPWNPMRMHQRVGRVNRYGQRHTVEVLSLRNPDTVESLVWQRLNEKIEQINRVLQSAMDDPEDLLELVLGMTATSTFRDIFAEASEIPKENFSQWFDSKTASFGEKSIIDTVKELVGNSSRFNYGEVGSQLPQLALADLKPFFVSMVRRNRRRIEDNGEQGISFRTPEEWRNEDVALRHQYEGLVFDRHASGTDSDARLIGVGHRLLENALRQAMNEPHAHVTKIPAKHLTHPLVALRVADQLTGDDQLIRGLVVAVELPQGAPPKLLRDWEMLARLNAISQTYRGEDEVLAPPPEILQLVQEASAKALSFVAGQMHSLGTSFRIPTARVIGIVWPSDDEDV